MNLELIWSTCFFWAGLLSNTLSWAQLLLGLGMFYLAGRIFQLQAARPSRFSMIAWILGSLWSPAPALSPLTFQPWQQAQAVVRVLQIQPSQQGLSAWCEIKSANLHQQEPMAHLIHQKASLQIPMKPNQKLSHLDWHVAGLMKISATGKVKFKKTDLMPIPTTSWLSKIKLTMLNTSLSWRQHIQRLSRLSSKDQDASFFHSDVRYPLGQSLIVAMLGSGRASARVDYILQRLGLSHLTAISGLHFALVGFLMAGLLRRLYMPWRLTAIATMSLLFLIVSTPSSSSLRAWIMSLIGIGCLITGRRYHALHALALTTLLWLVIYPEWASQIGFILSVYCTAILIAISPLLTQDKTETSFVEKRLKPWLSIQGAIFFFTAPLLLYWFHKLSWLSIAANLIVAPLFAASFAGALICLTLSFICFPLASYLLHGIYACTHYLLSFLADLPHRLDQAYYLELSQTSLIALLPWLLCIWIKLLTLKNPLDHPKADF